MKAAMSPSLYRIVVPFTRLNGQPVFNRRSRCKTFTLEPRMAAYTCSSTHAQGTEGTLLKSTDVAAMLIPSPLVGGSHEEGLGVPVSQCVPVFSLYLPRANIALILYLFSCVRKEILGHRDTC
jgi:hypothetical protein